MSISHLTAANIYITGFMGSGKTTAGRQIAAKLNYRFIDLDTIIQQAERRSIMEIFIENGEHHFRELETKYLQETFTYTATVISCGGGTPCFFNNIQKMNDNGITIYLSMNAKELFSRLKKVKQERPLLKGKTDDELLHYISEKLEEREPFYKQAKITIPGLNVNVNRVTEDLMILKKIE